MAIELTDTLKAQIIISAFTAAGPGANDDAILSQQSRILDALSDGSPMLNAFDRAKDRADQTVSTAGVIGEVIYVDTEATSNRPIVFLRTGTDRSTDGIEHFRLDRLDSQDSERVRNLANELMKLVGHRVLVQKVVEKGKGGNVRVIRGVQDRGPGAEDIAGLANSSGWSHIDWTASDDRRKIAAKLKRLAGYQQQGAPVAV